MREVQGYVKTQQKPFVHRDHFAWQSAGAPSVAQTSQAAGSSRSATPNLKTGEIELSIDRIHGSVQRCEFQILGKTHNRGVCFRAPRIPAHQKKFGAIVAN